MRTYCGPGTHGVQSLDINESLAMDETSWTAMPWVPAVLAEPASAGVSGQVVADRGSRRSKTATAAAAAGGCPAFAANRTDLVRYIVSLNLIGLFARKIGDLMIKRLFVRAFLGI